MSKKAERRREFLQRAQLSGNRPISDPSKRSRLRGSKYVRDPKRASRVTERDFKCPHCTEEMPDSARVQHLVAFHGYAEPGSWTK